MTQNSTAHNISAELSVCENGEIPVRNKRPCQNHQQAMLESAFRFHLVDKEKRARPYGRACGVEVLSAANRVRGGRVTLTGGFVRCQTTILDKFLHLRRASPHICTERLWFHCKQHSRTGHPRETHSLDGCKLLANKN